MIGRGLCSVNWAKSLSCSDNWDSTVLPFTKSYHVNKILKQSYIGVFLWVIRQLIRYMVIYLIRYTV